MLSTTAEIRSFLGQAADDDPNFPEPDAITERKHPLRRHLMKEIDQEKFDKELEPFLDLIGNRDIKYTESRPGEYTYDLVSVMEVTRRGMPDPPAYVSDNTSSKQWEMYFIMLHRKYMPDDPLTDVHFSGI